jgi:YbbR domain-containing protein
MWLRDLIFRDGWLKLFSLALAVLIWAVVTFAIRKEGRQDLGEFLNAPARVLRVPVLVMSAAADVRECRVNPEFVQVTIRGERVALEKLQERDVHAIVDLTDIESARGVRKRIEVTTPPGLVYTHVTPEDVEVMMPPKRPAPAAALTAP